MSANYTQHPMNPQGAVGASLARRRPGSAILILARTFSSVPPSHEGNVPAMPLDATNRSLTPDVLPVVEELERLATRPEVLAVLRRAQGEAVTQLQRDTALAAAFVPLNLVEFGAAIPAGVGSIRVVASRDRSATIERHANSTQYLLVLDGSVQTHVLTEDGWRVDRYGYDDATRLESRWHVVPPGVWHRTVAPGAHEWCVVAFHSAREVSDEYQ